jgi:hypothetical protein
MLCFIMGSRLLEALLSIEEAFGDFCWEIDDTLRIREYLQLNSGLAMFNGTPIGDVLVAQLDLVTGILDASYRYRQQQGCISSKVGGLGGEDGFFSVSASAYFDGIVAQVECVLVSLDAEFSTITGDAVGTRIYSSADGFDFNCSYLFADNV